MRGRAEAERRPVNEAECSDRLAKTATFFGSDYRAKVSDLVQLRACTIRGGSFEPRPLVVNRVVEDLCEFTGNPTMKGLPGYRCLYIDADGDIVSGYFEHWHIEPYVGPVGATAKH